MRKTSQNHTAQSKKQVKKKMLPLLTMSIGILVCIVALFGFYLINKTEIALPFLHHSSTGPLLVFNTSEGTPGSPTVTTIADKNGNILQQIHATQTDSTYEMPLVTDTSYSRGLITSDEIYVPGKAVTVTKYALINHEGSIMQISSALVALLNTTYNLSQVNILYHPVIANSKTMFSLVYPTYFSPNAHFDQFDLTTGKETTLLLFTPIDSVHYSHIVPEGIDASGTKIVFLVNDVFIDSIAVHGTAIILYNLQNRGVTVKSLPPQLAHLIQSKVTDPNAANVGPIGASLDGNMIMYQEPDWKGSINAKMLQWKTHLYNVQKQQDLAIPTHIVLPLGYKSYLFSPDNSYCILYFNNAMDIVATKTGKVVKSFYLGEDPMNPTNPTEYLYNITPVGWIDSDTLAYSVARSDVPGSSNFSAHGIAHTLTLHDMKIHDYPSTLGQLSAIIYN